MIKGMKRYLIVLIILIFALLLAYYIKCQLRISFFKSVSMSQYIPFKYLQANPNPINANPQTGVLLRDTFEWPFWSERKWNVFWAREGGLVENEYATDGAEGSKCLLVKSNSAKDWAYGHYKIISVKVGDKFGYEGRVRTAGDSKVALGVVTYNEDRKVIHWNYAAKTVNAAKDWVEAINEFKIPQDIKYIQFRLSGSGKGKTWIDNVVFSKL